jgi:hypothetical protein
MEEKGRTAMTMKKDDQKVPENDQRVQFHALLSLLFQAPDQASVQVKVNQVAMIAAFRQYPF